ncbi:MAG: pyruvate kinase [Candidatus Riflebacteria bacterium]|nr:pyruvate kinase [Candidatus Riflebacteria bacterium]
MRNMNKRTKIIATLGPSSSSKEVITELIKNGCNVFRLNFSHGTHESHKALIVLIREISRALGANIGILGDLCGPKIRVGKFPGGQVELKKGNKFTISENPDLPGDNTTVGSTYPHLVKDLKKGDVVLLDDGNISLRAIEKNTDSVDFEILQGGVLKDKKGMNMPGINLSIETITVKDKKDLEFIIKEDLDFVALSFVRKAEDIKTLKSLIGKASPRIIAKIEKPEAIADLENILSVTGGIMIARGDLGVEVPIEQVPTIQKSILNRCSRRGIVAITATQMLESMIQNSRPTRAETTDVFNAILDGSDAVMLSGETASGENPVEAVKVMSAIACEAEKMLLEKPAYGDMMPEVKHEIEDIIAHSACEAAVDAKAKAIVTFTHSGNTARNISKYHPPVSIIAMTPVESTCRRLALSWGVESILVPDLRNTDAMIGYAETVLKGGKFFSSGDIIMIVAGVPLGVKGNTNMIKLHKVY